MLTPRELLLTCRHVAENAALVPDVVFFDIPKHVVILELLLKDLNLREHLLLIVCAHSSTHTHTGYTAEHTQGSRTGHTHRAYTGHTQVAHTGHTYRVHRKAHSKIHNGHTHKTHRSVHRRTHTA